MTMTPLMAATRDLQWSSSEDCCETQKLSQSEDGDTEMDSQDFDNYSESLVSSSSFLLSPTSTGTGSTGASSSASDASSSNNAEHTSRSFTQKEFPAIHQGPVPRSNHCYGTGNDCIDPRLMTSGSTPSLDWQWSETGSWTGSGQVLCEETTVGRICNDAPSSALRHARHHVTNEFDTAFDEMQITTTNSGLDVRIWLHTWLATNPDKLPNSEELKSLITLSRLSESEIMAWLRENISIQTDSEATSSVSCIKETPRQTCTPRYRPKCRRSRRCFPHITEAQDEARTYECTHRCGQSFTKKGQWTRHERYNVEEWRCRLCSFVNARKDKLLKHLREAHNLSGTPNGSRCRQLLPPSARPCGFCLKQFSNWSAWLKHVGAHFEGHIPGGPWTMARWNRTVDQHFGSDDSGDDDDDGGDDDDDQYGNDPNRKDDDYGEPSADPAGKSSSRGKEPSRGSGSDQSSNSSDSTKSNSSSNREARSYKRASDWLYRGHSCSMSKSGEDRRFICSVKGCKYHEQGLPTEKERDHHMFDKHSANWHYHCTYCPLKAKHESNCKQHIEEKHGTRYNREKGNFKTASTLGQAPQIPSIQHSPSMDLAGLISSGTGTTTGCLQGIMLNELSCAKMDSGQSLRLEPNPKSKDAHGLSQLNLLNALADNTRTIHSSANLGLHLGAPDPDLRLSARLDLSGWHQDLGPPIVILGSTNSGIPPSHGMMQCNEDPYTARQQYNDLQQGNLAGRLSAFDHECGNASGSLSDPDAIQPAWVRDSPPLLGMGCLSTPRVPGSPEIGRQEQPPTAADRKKPQTMGVQSCCPSCICGIGYWDLFLQRKSNGACQGHQNAFESKSILDRLLGEPELEYCPQRVQAEPPARGGGLKVDTDLWFRKDVEIWLKSPRLSPLWISGNPRCGKSKLLIDKNPIAGHQRPSRHNLGCEDYGDSGTFSGAEALVPHEAGRGIEHLACHNIFDVDPLELKNSFLNTELPSTQSASFASRPQPYKSNFDTIRVIHGAHDSADLAHFKLERFLSQLNDCYPWENSEKPVTGDAPQEDSGAFTVVNITAAASDNSPALLLAKVDSGNHRPLITQLFLDEVRSMNEVWTIMRLQKPYSEDTLESRLIFIHRIGNPKMWHRALANVWMLHQLCGLDSLKEVALATAFWRPTEEGCEKEFVEKEFTEVLWENLKHPLLSYQGDEAGSAPEVIFGATYKRGETPKEHPNKTSNVLSYQASVIIHDISHTDEKDWTKVKTSSYLDITSRYSSSQKDQDKVRTHVDGLLKPGTFPEPCRKMAALSLNHLAGLERESVLQNDTWICGHSLPRRPGRLHSINQIVQRLLEKGADVNTPGGRYTGTALQAASSGGHDQIVQRLLETVANVNALGWSYSGTALQVAPGEGRDESIPSPGNIILPLAGGSNPMWVGDWELHTCDHSKLLRVYTKRILDFHRVDDELRLTAYFGLRQAMLALLRSGRHPDLKDTEYGQTPLWWAARNGHEAVVKLLLTDDRVDPDSKDMFDQTPLLWAAENGREAVVKLLLADDRIDPDSKDKLGQTPLS